METIDSVIARAIERGAQAVKRDPRALAVRLDGERGRLVLELVGGTEVAIPIAALGFPADANLSSVRIEGDGYDLYFPDIDEGAFIPDLIRAAVEHRLAA